jgi:DNA-binding beta-propeller fold protein YncE
MFRALLLMAALVTGAAFAAPIQGFFTPANDGSTATNGRILEFDASSGLFAGVLATPQEGSQISGMTYGPDGNLYASYWNAASNSNGRVLKITPDGTVTTFVAAASGGLRIPSGLTFGPDGNLYVASNQGGVLRFNGGTGAFLSAFATAGLSIPQDLLFGSDGRLYVSNGVGDSISRYDGQTGAFLGYLVSPGAYGLDAPIGLTMGPSGDMYVASFPTNRIFRFSLATGSLVSIFNLPGAVDGMDTLLDLVFGPDQSLYASVRSTAGGTDFLRLDADTGAVQGIFAHMDRPNTFNTGMLFVDAACASLGAAAGQASSCFVSAQVPEPRTLPLVLVGFAGIAMLRRYRHAHRSPEGNGEAPDSGHTRYAAFQRPTGLGQSSRAIAVGPFVG